MEISGIFFISLPWYRQPLCHLSRMIENYNLAYGDKSIPFNYGFNGFNRASSLLPTDLSKFRLRLRCNVEFKPLNLLAQGIREFECPLCSDLISHWNLSEHALSKHHSKGDSTKEQLITLKKFFTCMIYCLSAIIFCPFFPLSMNY